MATISEDYVSFETAKLLKEKGFDERLLTFYITDEAKKEGCFQIMAFTDDKIDNNHSDHCYLAPTHQMAMKWLREVYHIEINITFGFPFINGKQQYKYFWSIVRVCDNHLEYPMDDPNSAFYNEEMADSFEEAVESALKYCLENLI